MSKAITAHELPNPGGLVGALAKAVNGRFSVEKNLDGLPKSTPIMLLTDNEGLGSEGEKLRAKLAVAGYQVSGEQTFYGHLASNRLMGQYAEQIVGGLLSRTPAALDGADLPVRNQRVEQWQQPEVTPGNQGARPASPARSSSRPKMIRWPPRPRPAWPASTPTAVWWCSWMRMATIGWCMATLRNWPAISAGRWWGMAAMRTGRTTAVSAATAPMSWPGICAAWASACSKRLA